MSTSLTQNPVLVTDPNSLIERFQQSAPVDVTGLALALGINVWESDTQLPAKASGKLFRDPAHGGTQGYSIIVPASHPYVRRRFTVAHQIAHFILHRAKIGDYLVDDEFYRSGLGTREELEASRLAVDILTPEKLLDQYVMQYGRDPSVLADLFRVSEGAMRIRLGL